MANDPVITAFTTLKLAIQPQNNPLYLETFQQAGTGSEGALRFHYIVHCSLDAVEEKRERSAKIL